MKGSHLPVGRRTMEKLKDPELAVFIENLWIFAQKRGEPIGPELDGITAVVDSFQYLLSKPKTAIMSQRQWTRRNSALP